MTRLALAVLVVVLPACASVSTERTLEQDVLWAAALECKARFLSISEIRRIDPDGSVHFAFVGTKGAENEAFVACYQEGVAKRLSIADLDRGRVSVTTRKLSRVFVPIIDSNDRAFVGARLNGRHEGLLLVGTGSPLTILSPALASQLGIPPGPHARVRAVRFWDGTVLFLPIVRLASLAIGSFVVEGVDVGVYDVPPGAAGILGTDVRDHFRVGVDRVHRRVTLENLEISPADPDPTVAEAPVWSIGDAWTYRVETPRGPRSWTYVVRAAETIDGVDCWVVRLGRYEWYHRRADLATVLEKIRDGVDSVFDPPLRFFQWPLAAGRQWADHYVAGRTGKPALRSVTMMVESDEVVEVPAGTFRALKVVRRYLPGGTVWSEGWYAPEVKNWVRRIDYLEDGTYVQELRSFELR